jgi:hypothetical protein
MKLVTSQHTNQLHSAHITASSNQLHRSNNSNWVFHTYSRPPHQKASMTELILHHIQVMLIPPDTLQQICICTLCCIQDIQDISSAQHNTHHIPPTATLCISTSGRCFRGQPWHSRPLPLEWPRERIPRDSCGLLREMAWSPHLTELRSIDGGRSPGDQLLLLLQSDQACNCESCPIQEVLQCLGVSKTHHPSCTHSRMAWFEQYFRTVEEHWKFVVSHQRGWDMKLPVFLLACRASTHNTAGLNPSYPVFRRELCLHCDLLSGAPLARIYPPLTMWQTWIRYTTPTITPADIWSWPATEWKQQATKRVMMCGLSPNHTKGKPPKLQPSWEDPYKVITRINSMVYRIQWQHRMKIMVVHLEQLAPYQGTT